MDLLKESEEAAGELLEEVAEEGKRLKTEAEKRWVQQEVVRRWTGNKDGKGTSQEGGPGDAGGKWIEEPSTRRWVEEKGEGRWEEEPTTRRWVEEKGEGRWVEEPPTRKWVEEKTEGRWVEEPSTRRWVEEKGEGRWVEEPTTRRWVGEGGSLSETSEESGEKVWIEEGTGRRWVEEEGGGGHWEEDEDDDEKGGSWIEEDGKRIWVQDGTGNRWIKGGEGRWEEITTRRWVEGEGGGQWVEEGGDECGHWVEEGGGGKWVEGEEGGRWIEEGGSRRWIEGESEGHWVEEGGERKWIEGQGGGRWVEEGGGQRWIEGEGMWIEGEPERRWVGGEVERTFVGGDDGDDIEEKVWVEGTESRDWTEGGERVWITEGVGQRWVQGGARWMGEKHCKKKGMSFCLRYRIGDYGQRGGGGAGGGGGGGGCGGGGGYWMEGGRRGRWMVIDGERCWVEDDDEEPLEEPQPEDGEAEEPCEESLPHLPEEEEVGEEEGIIEPIPEMIHEEIIPETHDSVSMMPDETVPETEDATPVEEPPHEAETAELICEICHLPVSPDELYHEPHEPKEALKQPEEIRKEVAIGLKETPVSEDVITKESEVGVTSAKPSLQDTLVFEEAPETYQNQTQTGRRLSEEDERRCCCLSPCCTCCYSECWGSRSPCCTCWGSRKGDDSKRLLIPKERKRNKCFCGRSLLFLVVTSGFLFGYDSGVVSGSMLLIRPYFQLNTIWTQIIVSSTAGVAALTSGCAEIVADCIGRKLVILAGAVIFTAGAIIMWRSETAVMIIVGRMTVGFAMGFSTFVVRLYVKESARKEKKKWLIGLLNLFFTVGNLVANFTCMVLSYVPVNDIWKYILGLGALPSILQFVAMLCLPESPRWLLEEGYNEMARDNLITLRGTDQIDPEFEEMRLSVEEELREKEKDDSDDDSPWGMFEDMVEDLGDGVEAAFDNEDESKDGKKKPETEKDKPNIEDPSSYKPDEAKDKKDSKDEAESKDKPDKDNAGDIGNIGDPNSYKPGGEKEGAEKGKESGDTPKDKNSSKDKDSSDKMDDLMSLNKNNSAVDPADKEQSGEGAKTGANKNSYTPIGGAPAGAKPKAPVYLRIWRKPKVRRSVMNVVFLFLFQQLAGISVLILYGGTILYLSGMSSAMSLGLLNIPNLLYVVATYISTKKDTLEDNRKKLLMISFFGVFIGMGLIAVAFQLQAVRYSPTVLVEDLSHANLTVQFYPPCTESGYSTCEKCVRNPRCGFCHSHWLLGSCLPLNQTNPHRSLAGRCEKADEPASEFEFVIKTCHNYGWYVIVGMVVFVLFYAPGLGQVTHSEDSERCPVWARKTSNSWGRSTNWAANLVVSMSFLLLMDGITKYGTFWMFTGFCILGFFVATIFLAEDD